VNDRSRISVWLTHPGAAGSVYELFAALQGLGFRARFETGFYYKATGLLARIVALLPAKLHARVERELKRRHFPAIKSHGVRQHALLELAYVAAARAWPKEPERVAKVMHWRNRRFDRSVAASLRLHPPDLVIGQDTSALATIRSAKASGTISLLHQMIGHLAIGEQILREEALLQPAWADSLHADAPGWLIDQCRAEALEADHVIASSDYVRNTLIQIGTAPRRIHLLPYGVNTERFRPAATPQPNDRFRLLYVGQISQRKGLSYLLEAVKKIGDPNIELVLVGGIVGAGAGLIGYDGVFRHVRNVPHHEVIALFQSADAFVYPSLHEGSALAIYEALACGLPVITTENAGSVVRDGMDGVIVPIRDVDALVTQILRLRDDSGLRREMAGAARLRAEDFTWVRYRERLEVILDNILVPAHL
jgi:glycosyltransferase involved in cell wall biosynthesis